MTESNQGGRRMKEKDEGENKEVEVEGDTEA